MSGMIMSIVSTVIIVLLIFVVYYNNNQIHELNNNAININQYIKKGEVNDEHIFNSNTNIVNYLKSRDSMKQDLELLKQKVKTNTDKNTDQDNRLAKNDTVDKEQNRLINHIKDTYRSDMNYLVNLSFTEVQKHFPGVSNDENLKAFRELLYHYVILSLKDYKTFLPDYDLDKFINVYGAEVAFILSESIYKYKIYNSYNTFPSITLFKNEIVKELKNPVKLDFLIKTYFPRLFNYIESNSQTLFYRIKSSTPTFVSFASNDDFVKLLMKDSSIDLNKINPAIRKYLFVDLPTYYTYNLYHNSDQSSYLSEIDENMIQITLTSCPTLIIFYNTWKLYNVVKQPNNNLIIETEKTKLLEKMISNNSIFKRIYLDKVDKYNKKVAELENCNLPILPIVYKTRYNADEVNYPQDNASDDSSFFSFSS